MRDSRIFYSRVKGELEEAVTALAFEGIVIARPSFSPAIATRWDNRCGREKKVGLFLSTLLRPLIPANYRAIAAIDVAGAVLARVRAAQGLEVLCRGAMQG